MYRAQYREKAYWCIKVLRVYDEFRCIKKKETLLISFKGIMKSLYIYGTLGPYVLGEERYHCYFFFLINQNQQKILFEQGHIIATFWESTNLVKKTFWAHWLAFNLSKKMSLGLKIQKVYICKKMSLGLL